MILKHKQLRFETCNFLYFPRKIPSHSIFRHGDRSLRTSIDQKKELTSFLHSSHHTTKFLELGSSFEFTVLHNGKTIQPSFTLLLSSLSLINFVSKKKTPHSVQNTGIQVPVVLFDAQVFQAVCKIKRDSTRLASFRLLPSKKKI